MNTEVVVHKEDEDPLSGTGQPQARVHATDVVAVRWPNLCQERVQWATFSIPRVQARAWLRLLRPHTVKANQTKSNSNQMVAKTEETSLSLRTNQRRHGVQEFTYII